MPVRTPTSPPTVSLTYSFATHKHSLLPHPITLEIPPPLPPAPGIPPREPELQVAATPELQTTGEASFLLRRREYLIRKADHDATTENYEHALAGHNAHLAVLAKYEADMATYTPNLIAWSAADNRAYTVLLGALPDTLMRRFQSRLHTFTKSNPTAGLNSVVQWIIDTEVKLRIPIVNLTTSQPSSSSLNATQLRKGGGGKGGGGDKGGGSRGEGSGGCSGRGGRNDNDSAGGNENSSSATSGGTNTSGSSSGGRPGNLPPCTYFRRHGPRAGTPCGPTTHPPVA
ncbi:unnamed protein product [Closterium sp. NIES-53]